MADQPIIGATRFTDLVGCRVPIQLAGMGGLSTPQLAAAVSNAGGLGMVAMPTASPDDLADHLQDLRRATDATTGVTFIMPFLNPACVPVAAQHCRVVEFSFGEPDSTLVDAAQAEGAVVGWQIGTAVQAIAAVEAGVDYVIAQGSEAGGHHVAVTTLAACLPEVCDAVDLPVVAAGGIATSADVQSFLERGADAVRVGTRFAAAEEADVHPDYGAALVAAQAEDTIITTTFDVFWPDTPHRVLKTSVNAALAEGADIVGQIGSESGPTPVPTRAPLLPTAGFDGNVAGTAMYAGTSVHAVHRRQPAAEILDELTRPTSS